MRGGGGGGVEVEQETSAPPPKKNPGYGPETQITNFTLVQSYTKKWYSGLSLGQTAVTFCWPETIFFF